MSERLQPLIVRLPPELHQAVKDAARAADLSMAQWIRRAIRAELTDGMRYTTFRGGTLSTAIPINWGNDG